MSPKVERLDLTESVGFGEGPHWDAETQSLYFVDVFRKCIHKYVPATKKHTKATVGNIDDDTVSLVIPLKDSTDKFLISIGRKLATVTWDGESQQVSNIQVISEVEINTSNKLNDGKCDPSGRLWAGTMGPTEKGEIKREMGSLYSFENNKAISHISKLGISNGLAWNKEVNKLYFIDTYKGTVEEYDFDLENGTIANGKPIFTLAKHDIPGGPDGMTIDTDGNLWVAVFFGYRVIKIDPRRPETLLETIPIPAKEVTSVTFGGPNLDELYVTTGLFRNRDDEPVPPENAGIYRITEINAKGYPGVSVVL